MTFINWCLTGVKSWLSLAMARGSETGSPLPKTEHLVLPISVLRKRLAIISDVHGCLDEVEALLAKLKYSPETTTVIFVGDLVAKGPKSAEVIRFLMAQKGMYSVRGNHEDNLLLARYKTGSKYATRPAYAFASTLTDAELEFVRELPISISIPELQLLVVHAGVDPTKRGYSVSANSFADLIRIRTVDKEGRTSKEGPSKNRNLWGPLYTGPPLIVYGHDAKRKLQVHPWARGLDTGCCYGGSLTALVINDTSDTHGWMKNLEIVSVQAAKVYAEPDDD